MRRGFLKNPKPQSPPQEKPEPKPSATPNGKHTEHAAEEKEDEEAQTSTNGATPNNVDYPDEVYNSLEPLNPHRAPAAALARYQKNFDTQTTRFIFRSWPRDPNGEIAFMKGEQLGKQTPNGLIWGATLYDFYYYRPMADCGSYLATTSGSRLAAKMRQLGELDAAKNEIAWADKEPQPQQLVLPEQIGLDIIPREGMVWTAREQSDERHHVRSLRPKDQELAYEIPLPPPSDAAHLDITEIKPENYPGPWPLVPFSQAERGQGIKLETLIPYSLFPKELVVHDPWNLLAMRKADNPDAAWTEMTDITHIYTLSPLTKLGKAKCAQQEQLYNSAMDRGISEDVLIFPTDTNAAVDDSLPFMPPIRVKVPPYPHKKETPAAHLYLSPTHKAGTGNHSDVFYAEWELPRSLLVPDELCRGCINDEIAAMRKSGELAKLAKEVVEKARAEADPEDKREFGYAEKTVYTPASYMVDENGVPQNVIEPESQKRHCVYEGPMVEIETKVQWQTPQRGRNCIHLVNKYGMFLINPAPPTATVRVCAKLSKQGDRHLEREAKVYQALPAHLAEHYSGYNIVRPSREPVPVGAVVPQFYGYYLPPDCGRQVEPAQLNADQKKECWSLMYRLHDADWVQQSVATRNILMQTGPLTVAQGWMRDMGAGEDLRFRIIDFGRARYVGPPAEEGEEDVYADVRLDERPDSAIQRERKDIDTMLDQGFGANLKGHGYL
ncbi:hypothetical protein MKEN_01058800 [Mycena kentingensis (nom. inval.)]|nr:hypothetical protein MKEN_01058800 [Mycena kentingensis (nom. inval.)]